MLYLYQNILPNRNKQACYFKNFANYKTFLNGYLLKTINNDKYTINTEVLRVAIDEVLTPAKLDKVTYIIDEEEAYKRCYYVVSFNYQSGYAYLQLRIDLWGSYISEATFDNVYVQESTGKYRFSQLSNDYPFYYKDFSNIYSGGYNSGISYQYLDNLERLSNNEVIAVFSVKHNIYQTQDGAVSKVALLAINVRTLKQAWVNAGTSDANKLTLSKYNDLEVVARCLSGIFGGAYISSEAETFKAEILNAWLLPSRFFATYTQSKMYVACRTGSALNDGKITFEVEQIRADIIQSRININEQLNFLNPQDTNIFGTLGNGIKLKNSDKLSINYRVTFSMENVSVVIGQGNNEKDITNSFSIEITHNTGDVTPQRETATALNKLVAVFSGLIGGIGGIAGAVMGNPLALLGGGLSVAKTATGLINEETNKMTGQQIGSGSGFASFSYNQIFGNNVQENCKKDLHNPFCIVSFKTNYKSAYEHSAGIYENLYMGSKQTLFFHYANNELTGRPSTYNVMLYLKCKLSVVNVNEDGAKEIEERLANGLELTNIDA